MSAPVTAPTRCMHLDMDTFFVSVERLLDPSLVGRPVVVGGTPFQRGVVAGCSRDAHMFDIHSAMPLRRAWELCPKAVFLHPNFTHYAQYSERVGNTRGFRTSHGKSLDRRILPCFHRLLARDGSGIGVGEQTQTDHPRRTASAAYLRHRTEQARGQRSDQCRQTRRRHARAGGRGGALSRAASYSAAAGRGRRHGARAFAMGIPRIGDIAALPFQLFSNMYGKPGDSLHEHSRGIDHSPILPYRRRKSLGAENTYSEDVLDPDTMVATLRHLSQRIGHDLREQGFLASCVTLKLRYADFVTVTKSLRCEYSNADHVIYALAERCFRALYTRRVRVGLLGISTSDLIEDYGQLFLFEEKEGKYDLLYAGLDSIRRRFDHDALTYGSVLEERQKK